MLGKCNPFVFSNGTDHVDKIISGAKLFPLFLVVHPDLNMVSFFFPRFLWHNIACK